MRFVPLVGEGPASPTEDGRCRETCIIPVTISENAITGQGTNTFSSFTATSTVNAQVTGNRIDGTESLSFSAGCGPPPKNVTYSFTGTK
jgi:hypothetical protein